MAGDGREPAALNNALWCEAVCAAHGRPGEFLPGLWVNRHESPRFYPNAVTLSADGVESQQARLAALVEAGMPADGGIKDSFSTLDLVPLGFRVLFEAQWILRPASAPPPAERDAGLGWKRVGSAAKLVEWEAGWAHGDAAGGRPVFRPPLLRDADVCFVAVHRGARLVGGAIVNRGGGVAGLSNAFALEGEADGVRRECIAAAACACPDLDLVGYDAGAELAALRGLGFEALGPLRVWVRAAS